MKKIVILFLTIIIVFSGCKGNSDIGTDGNDSTDSKIKVVQEYNKAVFSKDWNSARSSLAGNALNIFEGNYKNYEKSSFLINQYNEFIVDEDLISIVDSKIDYSMTNNNEKVLTSKWIRFYIENVNGVKITKTEEIPYKYSKKIKLKDNQFGDVTGQVVKDFIQSSIEGNTKKASKYLSGNLLMESEKYKIDSFPKNKIKTIETQTLACFEKEQIIKARYELENNQKINLNFRLIHIDNIWLIDEIIN